MDGSCGRILGWGSLVAGRLASVFVLEGLYELFFDSLQTKKTYEGCSRGGNHRVKCQHCEKPATFHITELTEPSGPLILHLCEEHARVYLSQDDAEMPSNALASMLAKQLKLEQTAEQLAALDKKTCPICGISFAEFRQAGRLGCPYDYVCFQDDLEPLLTNIHGSKTHRGKVPARNTGSPDKQHELIQLRREMQEAIVREEYERAGELRDAIQTIEREAESSGDPVDD